MTVLEELERSIQDAARDRGPSVVGLGRGWGVGSGVVIGAGLVLTNAHNLHHDEIAVTFADGRREPGSLAGSDPDLDLAVISVDTGEVQALDWTAPADGGSPAHGNPPAVGERAAASDPPAVGLRPAASDPPAVGERPVASDSPAVGERAAASDPPADRGFPPIGRAVLALANPGGRGLRVAPGFVTGSARSFRGPRGRRIPGAIEHTAPLPSGSSGGPLLDTEGRLLAINTVRIEGGLILAIALDVAMRQRIDALARGEGPSRARLGILIMPPRAARKLRHAVGLPERDGILIRGVEDDSPASRAGLLRGDLIVAAGGRATDRLDALHEALDAARGAGEIELTLVRGAQERTVTARF